MGLSSITIPTRVITIPANKETFEVRGVAAQDVMLMVGTHAPQMAMAYAKLKTGMQGSTLSAEEVKRGIGTLIGDFPELVTALLLSATDEDSEAARINARRLPAPVQVEAIRAIFELTFASEADVKKFIESLAEMMAGVAGTLTMASAPTTTEGGGPPSWISQLGIGE